MLKITKDIDKEKLVAFELGDGDDKLCLMVPYAELNTLKICIDEFIEKNNSPQPDGEIGFLLLYSGTIKYATNRGSIEIIDD